MGSQPRRRGWWTGPLLLAAAGVWLAGGGGPAASPPGEPAGGEVSARVIEVIDGDTVAAQLEDGSSEHIRYIGINTPESTPNQPLECFGHQAAAANRRLVGGRAIRLEFGPERRDDYGRLLAFVYAGPAFVNARLVRTGYARSLTIAPNDTRAPLFESLEARAASAGRGLWGYARDSSASRPGTRSVTGPPRMPSPGARPFANLSKP